MEALQPSVSTYEAFSAGKTFVSKLAIMYKALVSSSAMETIVMKVAVVLPILLLQKPSPKSKTQDHSDLT